MTRFILWRLAGSVMALTVATFVVFVVVRLIPGDPIATMLFTEYSEEVAASLRRLYGLDQPILVQFWDWLGALSQGDFGYSLLTGSNVADLLVQRIPRTLALLAGGISIGLLIAIPAGIFAAFYRGRLPDGLLMGFTTVLMSIPQFWLGILLLVLFAVVLQVLPGAGYVPWSVSPIGFLRSMTLPWITIGFSISAFIARVLRSSLLDTLNQDYIRTAEARGLTQKRIVLRHALRNAAIPTVTVIGLEVGYLIGGAIVVETVFSFPGVGRLLVTAILQRDYPIIQITLLFFAGGFVLVNLLTDISYGFFDPRVRSR
jgi:peptide/nickel transport system permease protein